MFKEGDQPCKKETSKTKRIKTRVHSWELQKFLDMYFVTTLSVTLTTKRLTKTHLKILNFFFLELTEISSDPHERHQGLEDKYGF